MWSGLSAALTVLATSPAAAATAEAAAAALGPASSPAPTPLPLAAFEDCAGSDDGSCAASWLQRAARRADDSVATSRRHGEVPKGNGTAAAMAQTATMNVLGENEGCPKDTGGTCMLMNCDASRGEVECVQHRCLCQAGYCNNHGHCVKDRDQPEPDPSPVCSQNTGGTCKMASCYSFRGPVECISDQCVCRPGYCNILGTCWEDRGTFTAGVVPVNADEPNFPPAQAGLHTALVFSGGGTRSQAASIGALRALEELGLMRSVDAISSVSGGTWAAAPYMFSRMSITELLGAPTDPRQLTLAALAEQSSALGTTCTSKTLPITTSWIALVPLQELWVHVVRQAILEPLGLGDMDSYMAADDEAVRRIKEANPQLRDKTFLTPAPGRPRAFVISGAILAPTGYEGTEDNVVSLQMSPDHTGSPFYPNNGPVAYHGQSGRSNEELHDQVIGGGFLESFAFGSLEPEDEGAGGTTRMRAPLEPLSLAKAVGITSAGPSEALTQVGTLGGSINVVKLAPRMNVWPEMGGSFAGRHQTASTYLFGDGGNIDNSGLLAMLQRRVSRIVWFINTENPLPESRDTDYCKQSILTGDQAAKLDSQLLDKFGRPPTGFTGSLGQFLTHNQVFNETELTPLLCDLQRANESVVRKELTVMKNAWWGITGGWKATLVVFHNAKIGGFVDLLPEETREELGRHRSELSHFPHYGTVFENPPDPTALTASQTNLLAAQTEYAVKQSEGLLRGVLSPVPA